MNVYTEIFDLLDGREARMRWALEQQLKKENGEEYDTAINNELWLKKYIACLCD